MKKHSLFAIALLLLSGSCFSQDKGFVGLSIGAAAPVGDFASTDVANNASGFAKNGASFDLTFGYKLHKNIGISAMLRSQANSTDAQALANQVVASPGQNWTISSGSWRSGALLVGGFGSFPLSKKLSLDAKIMLGFLSAASPEFKFTESNGTASAWEKQNSANATAFTYLLAAGLRYNAGEKICLLANLDYTGAKPEFKDVETTSSFGNSSKSTFSQNLSTIGFNIGVGLRLFSASEKK